jgi:phosphohistidine phosphatase
MQSAQALADQLKPSQGTSPTDGLHPMDDPNVWADRISGLEEDMILVGHLPHLARLVSLLLNGEPDAYVVSIETAGIVCLNRGRNDQWSIKWMIVPQLVV